MAIVGAAPNLQAPNILIFTGDMVHALVRNTSPKELTVAGVVFPIEDGN